VKPQDHVLCGLSGGVDSTVVATMLTRLLGPERVHCIFVNNGLLRHQEFEEVEGTYKRLGLNIKAVNASQKFLSELKASVILSSNAKSLEEYLSKFSRLKLIQPGIFSGWLKGLSILM
jgi:GMP synthase PP-ATPase subunit